MREILLVLGMVARGPRAARLRASVAAQSRCALLFLAATYVAAWTWTDSHVAGLVAVTGWFFLPWLEILTRVRHLRLPLDKALKSGFPPSFDRFPQLREMTGSSRPKGSSRSTTPRSSGRARASSCACFTIRRRTDAGGHLLLEQGNMALAWVSLASRTPDDRIWTTWNYPFSQTMKLPPETHLQAVLEADSFAGLARPASGASLNNRP